MIIAWANRKQFAVCLNFTVAADIQAIRSRVLRRFGNVVFLRANLMLFPLALPCLGGYRCAKALQEFIQPFYGTRQLVTLEVNAVRMQKGGVQFGFFILCLHQGGLQPHNLLLRLLRRRFCLFDQELGAVSKSL
ncbi:hypothetical protein LP421_16035 [Rhizobium sp. RCAM05350]|nr:hypothetical protein LP421_16035 [Rhizobium sp. RCAM05350]